MDINLPEISPHRAQFLALFLAVLGICMLYFWPLGAEYKKMEISQVAIAGEGKWVTFSGDVDKVTPKTGGYTVRVCDGGKGCVSVYADENTAGDWAGDDPLFAKSNATVYGEIAKIQQNSFVRAHRIEMIR